MTFGASLEKMTAVSSRAGRELPHSPNWYGRAAPMNVLQLATGEYFYHANIRTPQWLGYFIQRPEHHSIHHQLDVHKYNFGDLTIWDRLFGTFKEAEAFAPACGFPGRNEERLGDMLLFRDVYESQEPAQTQSTATTPD